MCPSSRCVLTVAFGAMLFFTTVGSVASASPASVSVCEPCSDRFVHSAEHRGFDVAIERSTATVRVHENGTARWTVHNRLVGDDGIERLQANRSALEAIARNSFSSRAMDDLGHQFEGVRIDGDGVVTMRYRTEGIASWSNGVLLVDYFRDEPGVYVFSGLGADELTVVGPSGTTVTSGLPGGEAAGRQITVTAERYDPRGDGPFVAFGEASDALAGAKTTVAIAAHSAPVFLTNFVALVVIPVGALAALSVGLVRSTRRFDRRWTPRDRTFAAGLVAALGIVGILHPFLAGVLPFVTGFVPPLLAVGVGFVAVSTFVALLPERFSLPVSFVVVGGALGAGVLAVRFAPAVLPGVDPPRLILRWISPAVPVLLALPAGYAARSDSTRLTPVVLALPVVAVAAGIVAFYPLLSHPGSLFFVLPIFFTLGALGIGIAGLPLFALGAIVADGARTDSA